MASYGIPLKDHDIIDEETATVDSEYSGSDEGGNAKKKKSSGGGILKKRGKQSSPKQGRLTTRSKMYDLDGDGVLDEAELAMRNIDQSGRGYLTNEEVYRVVQQQLAAQKDANLMKKAIAGLVCFVFVLALSNLGTSFASAVLAKEMKADHETATMVDTRTGETIGVNTAGDTYTLTEMSDEERRERRMQILAELEEDPHGAHAHRRLKNCKGSLCDRKIVFDNGVMEEEAFRTIEQKCQQKKNVNILKKWDDGTEKSVCMCSSTTSIVTKPKKRNTNNGGKVVLVKGNKQKRVDNEVVLVTDGEAWNVDCEGGRCHMGGTATLSREYEPCNLRFGDDDCRAGLQCVTKSEVFSNRIKTRDASRTTGWCVVPVDVDVVTVIDTPVTVISQRGREGEICDVTYGLDACRSSLDCITTSKRSSRGICTYRTGRPVVVETTPVIVKFAGVGDVCDFAYGNNACISGYYCYSSGRSAVTGICMIEEVVVAPSIVQYAGIGEVCDFAYGDNACVAGYYCYSARGGVAMSTGICTIIESRVAPPEEAIWYPNFVTHKCVRSCASGLAPNCDGLKPKWETSTYPATVSGAENCCETHFWWEDISDCIPAYPIV